MARGGAEGTPTGDALRRAERLEGQLAHAGEDAAKMRRECAEAYLSCGRRALQGAAEGGAGGEGDGAAALGCLEKAAAINGLWSVCAETCGQHARARQKAGAHAGAVEWFGHALSLADRADDQRSPRARKKRQGLADRCIESWQELVKDPAPDMDGPYRTALRADPSRAQTHLDMGYVLAGRGLAGRAAECYEAACVADPESVEARFRAGTALEEAGDHGKAAMRYAEAAKMDAGLSRRAAAGCAQCGRSLAAAGRRAEAAAALEAAVALDPERSLDCARAHEDCAAAMRAAGGAQYEMPPQGAAGGGGAAGHYARAVELYQKAGGEDRAEGARGCARCGRELGKEGMLADAAASLEAAADMDPAHSLECARAHEEAAGAMRDMADGGEAGAAEAEAEAAARHYREAARRYAGPEAAMLAGGDAGGGGTIGDARGCARCGRALAEMGRLGDAAAALEAAARLDPAHSLECARAHEEAAGAMRARAGGDGGGRAAEHYAKSVSWYQRRRGGGQDEAAEGCARCGRALAEMERLGDAAAALEAAACLDPAHSLECARLHKKCAAEASSRRGGDAGAAAAHYRKASEWYGAAPRGGVPAGAAEAGALGRIECGKALREMGRLEDAAEALAGAAALDPSRALECARACIGMAGRASADGGEGRGDPQEILRLALECCATGSAGGAGGPELRMAAADALLGQRRYAEAAAEYGRACAEDGSLRPACAAGCIRCGDGLAASSGTAEALACIRGAQAAGTVGPAELEEACARWGRAMFDNSRYAEAARCFEAGAAAAPGVDGAAGGGIASRLGLAASLSMDGRRGEAVAAYREAQARAGGASGGAGHAAALSGSAGGGAARLAIADALLESGERGEAEQWYATARAVGTGAERSSAYIGIARSLHAGSMHAAAHASLAMAAAAGGRSGGPPGTGRLCAGIGAGLEADGMDERAAECYEMAAERDAGMGPECGRACMRIGRRLEEGGMRGAAVRCYEAAARMVERNHEAHFAVADAMAADGNYNRAAWYYETAGRRGGDAARAGAGAAVCRASDLFERALDEVDMPTKRQLYRDAETAYSEAAGLSPGDPGPLTGAGRACLKQRGGADDFAKAEAHFAGAMARGPGLVEPCMYAGKAVRKHAQATRDVARYADALRYYDEAAGRRPDTAVEAKYWRGVCMLCGGDEAGAKEYLRGVLDEARPEGGEELHFLGRICDILGRHGEAAEHYLGSLRGSGLYSADFYERIDRGMVRSGAVPAAAGASWQQGGGKITAGGGGEPQYVCDTNVVIMYLKRLARETAFESPIVPMFEKGMCSVPQVCYNEAYGNVAGSEPLFGMLSDEIRPLCTVIKGRNRMDARMRRAREAFMAAWLYSGEDAVKEWCRRADEKAATKASRYAGGPPSGRDVLVLATAIDMYVRQPRPASVKLVTWDVDFATFGDWIRAETGVEVVRPEDMGGEQPRRRP